jgi:DNA-binding MarR family transcriptional regulator
MPDDERSRRDELLGRAEELCRANHLRQTSDVRSDQASLDEDHHSLERASSELERLFLRRRLLTDDVFADRGWLIMVDLFASELQQIVVELDNAAARWKLSGSTATRQLATLIASGLVERSPSTLEGNKLALKLTERGHSAVTHILLRAE